DVQTKHMVETFEKAAKDFGAQIEIDVNRAYTPIDVSEDSEIIKLAKKAFSNLGIEGHTESTGGGSDTN
ncbi:peptidase M20, partial [Clostridioides difficile]|nr:peptidase M20 [Clostridioides difficile]NJB09416.1 peptidase M20 [Clostridioides difficile]